MSARYMTTEPVLFRAPLPKHTHATHSDRTVIHQCPPDGTGIMPCCGRMPLEVRGEVMTMDPAMVTCRVPLMREARCS